MKIKDIIQYPIGLLSTGCFYLFGGLDLHIQALFFAMVLDFILGLICAIVFGTSQKTEGGHLSSNALFKGLLKKFAEVAVVALCYRIDCMLKTDSFRNGAIVGFVAGESISILENIGLMGVPIPAKLKKMLEVLNKKVD